MANPYASIGAYLRRLTAVHNFQICIKDYSGFIPINKELDEVLQPYLGHTNAFCMYIKRDPAQYRKCLTMIRKMHDRLLRDTEGFCGMCHAGLREYVFPIRHNGLLLGSVNVGFFQQEGDAARTRYRIRRVCRTSAQLEADTAEALFAASISPPLGEAEDAMLGLRMLADYLGATYGRYAAAAKTEAAGHIHHMSSEDTVLSHAMEYARLHFNERVYTEDVAQFCHCSVSYLGHIFKRRTGTTFSVYLNKIRVEIAKKDLEKTNYSVAEIAVSTGFNDPNYFCRVFTHLMGISPSEYRRRFRARQIPLVGADPAAPPEP